MTIQLNEENDGKLLTIHVSGKLIKDDYAEFVPAFERLVRQHGKLRVLFDMTDFHGWDVGAAWEDLKFGVDHFSDIERMAMVGEKKWQEAMAIFAKPFTKALVRYFDHAQAAEARKWVDEAQRSANTLAPFMQAYEACLSATSMELPPRQILPADDKKNARLIVSRIILDTFNALRMRYPESDAKRRQELLSIRKQLVEQA